MRKRPENPTDFLRYAGLAMQWVVMLGLGVWAGHWLDARLNFKALFIIILPLLALGISLWSLIKSLKN